jgi:hypothetical protein
MTIKDINTTYQKFDAPITDVDCGKKCAPHNEGGVPFCCDARHAIPTLYDFEWEILQKQTMLWREWECDDPALSAEEQAEETRQLQEETPDSMILAVCKGVEFCERENRSFTCRQFPFFPYIDSQGNLLGITYYWDYEEVCWVISNLSRVTDGYRQEMIAFYEKLFEEIPEEKDNYQYHSERMRDEFNEQRKAIPLLHRNGNAYKISTHNERMRRFDLNKCEKFGVYTITDDLLFEDEI